MSTAIFSTAYLPSIQYFSMLKKHSSISIEQHEHFVKQTYRNRCHIYGANGLLKLTVPIVHAGERTPIKDIKISYEDNWAKIHWRSIESAYRRSPYFEYYEHEFEPYFSEKKFIHLIDLNNALTDLLLKLLKINTITTPNSAYVKIFSEITDLREAISPKKNALPFSPPRYIQVFENKYGFIPNLSVIDLLFNEGPKATELL